jgi:hypothetical protein
MLRVILLTANASRSAIPIYARRNRNLGECPITMLRRTFDGII